MADDGKPQQNTDEKDEDGGPHQPKATNAGPTTMGDATVIFLVACGQFMRYIFTVSILAYFFWIGILYMAGATLLLVGFRYYSPSIDQRPVCPALQTAYFITSIWYLLGTLSLSTAYGYTYIESMEADDFTHLTAYTQVVGFLTKVVPTWTRLAHVFNLCQFNIIVVYLLFLPECNGNALLYISGGALMIWWAVILISLWAKRSIFVPPFLYDAPGTRKTILRGIHTMMRRIGP